MALLHTTHSGNQINVSNFHNHWPRIKNDILLSEIKRLFPKINAFRGTDFQHFFYTALKLSFNEQILEAGK